MGETQIHAAAALLILARAHQAVKSAIDIMQQTPLSFYAGDAYVMVLQAATAILSEIVDHEGSPTISEQLKRRLFQEADLIGSLPPLPALPEGEP